MLVFDSDYSPGEEKYSNDKEASRTENYEFFYDENEMDMRGKQPDGDWMYLRPQLAGNNTMRTRNIDLGERVFYAATGRKFYGNYLWLATDNNGEIYKDEQGNSKYWDMFSEDIYKDLR